METIFQCSKTFNFNIAFFDITHFLLLTDYLVVGGDSWYF